MRQNYIIYFLFRSCRTFQKEVNKTFVQNGRIPGKGNSGNPDNPDKKTELGKKLGQRAASVNKQAQAVLNHYIKGGKS